MASRVRRERRNTIILGIERWRVGTETIRSPQPVLLTMTKEKKSRVTKSDHDQFFFLDRYRSGYRGNRCYQSIGRGIGRLHTGRIQKIEFELKKKNERKKIQKYFKVRRM